MAFVGRRLLHSIFVLWAVATILFLMFRLMPGNPLAAYISEALSAEQQNLIMQQFGLDRPLWEQYVIYFGNLVQGELGTSFHRREPVLSIVLSVLPNTIILTFCGLFIAYAFGILAGAYLAWHRGTWIEGVVVPIALATRAAPEFWLGMILLAVFAFWLGWFPSGGANSAGAMYAGELDRIFSRDFLLHLTLPALTIALYLQGLPLLLMRSTMIEAMHEEFVTMARMKGLSEWRIVIHHAARNSLLPVLTAFALAIGPNISANVVVETVFSWPGLGRLLVQAVSTSDYPLAQGAFFLIALVVIVMNLVADLLYGFLDPRVSHGR
ncbi:MAG: ABC transporter permease [Microvirga sp.]|jgi:peptide/nickel transport system permease protein|nr:ABC transporter permease [Beijerinckiaceae bacterium]